MHIEIEKQEVTDRQFTSKTDGVINFTRVQPALLWKEGENYPDKIIVPLSFTQNQTERDTTTPKEIGHYKLADLSYYTDNFGNLKLGQLQLLKIENPRQAKR